MTPPLTDAELAEIERRYRAAFPGPWRLEGDGEGGWELVGISPSVNSSRIVLAARQPWPKRAELSLATGAFLEAAIADVPRLVEEVRRLRALVLGREPGCRCHREVGDSPCPVHGMDDENDAQTTHSQPADPATTTERATENHEEGR